MFYDKQGFWPSTKETHVSSFIPHTCLDKYAFILNLNSIDNN
jgi:hypothetical protein